jgi:hypothetical protein
VHYPQGGCDRAAAIALIRQEREAIGWQLARPTDWIAARLAEALHRPQGGVDAIRPDIVGEAFLLRQLAVDGRLADEQAAIVARARDRDAASVVGSVIRTVQDFAGERGEQTALGWLDHLVVTADDLPALIQITTIIPERTLTLRERAAVVQDAIVDALRAIATGRPSLTPVYASALNNLGVRLNALSRLPNVLRQRPEPKFAGRHARLSACF